MLRKSGSPVEGLAESGAGTTTESIKLPPGLVEVLDGDLDYLEIGVDPIGIKYPQINALLDAQSRKTYDGLVELAQSIGENNLLHPLTVAELDLLDAIEYIGNLNALWGTDHTIEDLASNDEGNYYIVIAGHRRKQGIDIVVTSLVAQDASFDPERVHVKCNVHKGISLEEALRLQITENTHAQVPPHEDAYSIQMYYEKRLKEAEGKLSVAQCARELGKSEEKVRHAIRFCELPLAIRKVVEDKYLAYGAALELYPYAQVLRQKEAIEGNSDRAAIETIVEDKLMAMVARIHKFGWRKDKIREIIQGYVSALEIQQCRFELELDDMGMSPSGAERFLAALDLGAVALTQVALLLDHVEPTVVNHPKIRELLSGVESTLQRIHNPEPATAKAYEELPLI